MSIHRRQVLGLALGGLGWAACQRGRSEPRENDMPQTQERTGRMPVLFVGHGSPMNIVEDNAWSRGFAALGNGLPEPRAILAVSAHWYVSGTFLTGNDPQRTIHDFGGFPPALYEIQYPARGDAELAGRVSELLADRDAALRADWGLDHGTWSVLHHMRPAADLPVVQLSIDQRLPPAEHLAIGRALAPLREQGILILASGNIVHNLRHAFGSMRTGDTTLPGWAERFDADVAAALDQRDHEFLARALSSDTGRQSHPTPDHYFPLLYAAGAAGDDPVAYPLTGFDLGSISMRAVRFGG
jgi:4,5-DOPA dioxygenase extradiol